MFSHENPFGCYFSLTFNKTNYGFLWLLIFVVIVASLFIFLFFILDLKNRVRKLKKIQFEDMVCVEFGLKPQMKSRRTEKKEEEEEEQRKCLNVFI